MTLPFTPPKVAHDQARVLRQLIERNSRNDIVQPASACRTIAVVGGKGGVGKSMLALNLAVTLAQQGRSVCLMDASFGLGSLDLMCGLNGYWNLSHVITGARQLQEVILQGPEGIHLLPGASGLSNLPECPTAVQRSLLDQLHEVERQHEVLIIDTGCGIHRLVRQFAFAADQLLVVTTPEPTAITDAYATIKSLCTADVGFGLLVNFVDSNELAMKICDRLKQTAQMFVQADVSAWGFIPRDGAVPQSIAARHPLATFMPSSPAARAISKAAAHCLAGHMNRTPDDTYFARLSQTLNQAA